MQILRLTFVLHLREDLAILPIVIVFTLKTRMTQEQRQKYQVRADILKALAHPTRLFIVEELSRQERCVQDITAMIGVDISTVSKHLAILKRAGIVRDEKRGSQVYYYLRTPCVTLFFSCIESVLLVTEKPRAVGCR
jgi:ArsR family transcriptional regulator